MTRTKVPIKGRGTPSHNGVNTSCERKARKEKTPMSSNNTAMVLDSIVSTLVSSYNVPEKQVLVRVERKARTVKAEKAPQVTAHKIPLATIPVAAKGTLDAMGFMMALRNAGKVQRSNESGILMTITDPKKEKEDQIQAIAAFVGYDFGGAHGTQLDSARQRARFTLQPAKGSKVAATVRGFVAGMPNGTEKAVRDLQARIRVATETMLDHEKTASKFAEDTAEYATHMALATVESERIAHMRKDLSKIV